LSLLTALGNGQPNMVDGPSYKQQELQEAPSDRAIHDRGQK
jgi:hypothetical protein